MADPDILAAHAANMADKPAVVDDRPGRPVLTWTFGDLNGQANRLAHLLTSLGVARDDKVVWCGHNSAPQRAARR